MPLTQIKISGKFNLSDAHSWISNCIPDVPPNVSSDDHDQVHTYFFKSLFIGTHLILEMSKGNILLKSDNISVLTIIKVKYLSILINFNRNN
jgi:Bardet-Biedl syndrome 7 protein